MNILRTDRYNLVGEIFRITTLHAPRERVPLLAPRTAKPRVKPFMFYPVRCLASRYPFCESIHPNEYST